MYAFDLETWEGFTGIAVAAIHDHNSTRFFETGGDRPMNKAEAGAIVDFLCGVDDYIVAHNGAAFDFRVLAEASGQLEVCTRLALNSFDPMLFFVAKKGWATSLDATAQGMGVTRKVKEVSLIDGSQVKINGEMAPQLWRRGEREAVREYLKGDVVTTLAVAELVWSKQFLKTVSSSGREWVVAFADELPVVHTCLSEDWASPSWIKNPFVTKEKVMEWMDAGVLSEYNLK